MANGVELSGVPRFLELVEEALGRPVYLVLVLVGAIAVFLVSLWAALAALANIWNLVGPVVLAIPIPNLDIEPGQLISSLATVISLVATAAAGYLATVPYRRRERRKIRTMVGVKRAKLRLVWLASEAYVRCRTDVEWTEEEAAFWRDYVALEIDKLLRKPESDQFKRAIMSPTSPDEEIAPRKMYCQAAEYLKQLSTEVSPDTIRSD